MVSAFERFAVQRVIDQAEGLGIEVSDEVRAVCLDKRTNPGALLWVKANPDRADESFGCCWGDINNGPDHCLCWWPVYADVQQDPNPQAGPVVARDGLCGDCAWRPGSPERSDGYSWAALKASADEGTPFWCHDGMRRPVAYRHPDGREVPGDPDNWTPHIVDGVPYRLDGRPAMHCAGWAARASRKQPRPDVISTGKQDR